MRAQPYLFSILFHAIDNNVTWSSYHVRGQAPVDEHKKWLVFIQSYWSTFCFQTGLAENHTLYCKRDQLKNKLISWAHGEGTSFWQILVWKTFQLVSISTEFSQITLLEVRSPVHFLSLFELNFELILVECKLDCKLLIITLIVDIVF